MTRKRLIIVTSTFLIAALIFLVIRLNEPGSFGEIEIQLSTKDLKESELEKKLKGIYRVLEKYKLSNSEQMELTNDLRSSFFLSREDSLIIEQIAYEKSQITYALDNSFFLDNKIKLFRLFFKLLNAEVFQKYSNPGHYESNRQALETARWIANRFDEFLNNHFLESQLEFHQNLSQRVLKQKLLLELCYGKAFTLLKSNPKYAVKYVGAGVNLAKKIADKKRELELLARLQFVLNESFGMIKVALALGHDLIRKSNRLEHVFNRALVLFYNGHILIDKGQYEQALKEYESSLELYDMLSYQNRIIDLTERIALVNRRLGRFDLALEYYQKMFELEQKHNMTSARIRYLLGVGLVRFEMGQFDEAERSYLQSLHLAQANNFARHEVVALINLGDLFFEIGDYGKALKYKLNALEQAEAADFPFLKTAIWQHLTKIHIMNNEIEKAKNCMADVVKHLEKFDFGRLKANHYLNIGEMQLQIGELESALQSFNQSLSIFVDMEVVERQIKVLNLIGETHRRGGNFDDAITILNMALKLEAQFPQLLHQSGTHYYLARTYKDLNDLRATENNLNESISFVKRIANDLHNNEQRSNFSQKIQPIFEEMVLLQLDKDDVEKAFCYAEEERAQTFKILLQEKSGKEKSEKPLISRIGFNRTLSEQSNALLKRVREQIDLKTVIVEYEMTDNWLIIWAIRKNGFDAVRVELGRDTVDELITEFRDAMHPDRISTPEQVEISYDQTQKLGGQFYKLLIEPVADYVNDAELIYFIPDETLHYLPFAAIVTPENNYLIEDFAIASMSSAAILLETLERRKLKVDKQPAQKRFLSVASDMETKFSVKEVIEIAEMFSDSESLLGKQATESALRNKIAEEFDIILFSNHGTIDEKRAYYSYLSLSNDSTEIDDSENDGFLRVHEIQDMNIHSTDFVYLSSCESASGKLYRGEGMVGMQRAFVIAGANSVIANLWQIEDRAAKNLTVHFFEIWLQNKLNKAQALQRSQLHMINRMQKDDLYARKPHPYFWASATLTGAYH